MSSIATSVPTGVMANGPDWCIYELFADFYSSNYSECANSTRGTEKADFQTICCDGMILDTENNLWTQRNFSEYPMDVGNLVCCRQGGQLLPGGIQPIQTNFQVCEPSQIETPLASLAATNTDNAELYLLTYESASWNEEKSRDDNWVRTETPMCMWIQTTHPDVTVVEVKVPAAQITTLPPPTTDKWGDLITTNTGTGPVTDGPGASETLGPATPSSSSSAAVRTARMDQFPTTTSVVVCLGLLASAWIL